MPGRVLPVGIAHPLKIDHPVGPMATAENDSEPEEFEDVVKVSSNKDTMLAKQCSNHDSSSKEDQSSDDNEEQNASSSADTSDSSFSSSDEGEDGGSREIEKMSYKQSYKRENKDRDLMEPSHYRPKPVMKSPYKGEPSGQSHSYSRSSKCSVMPWLLRYCIVTVSYSSFTIHLTVKIQVELYLLIQCKNNHLYFLGYTCSCLYGMLL